MSPMFTFQQVMSAIRSGVNPEGTLINHSSLWDLSSAFFFAGTVITTIGETHTPTLAHMMKQDSKSHLRNNNIYIGLHDLAVLQISEF